MVFNQHLTGSILSKANENTVFMCNTCVSEVMTCRLPLKLNLCLLTQIDEKESYIPAVSHLQIGFGLPGVVLIILLSFSHTLLSILSSR